MSDEFKKACYESYKKYKNEGINWNEIPEEEIERLTLIDSNYQQKEYVINRLMYINDIIEMTKEITSFGIELEYAGRNTLCNASHELTETVKFDGSVWGDGREWNLKPQRIEVLSSQEYQRLLESWMVTASKHGCLVHRSAGQHVHLGEVSEKLDYSDYTPKSSAMSFIGDAVRRTFNRIYSFDYRKDITDENGNILSFADRIYLNKKINEETITQDKKCYEALQFLYSVSNRSGVEEYGLGTDGTRGYTHHATVEIRVFRTTTDYRSVIARTYISKFFAEWCSQTRLAYEGYLEWSEIPSIWDELEKEENKKTKDMYIYLAFHNSNRHEVGLSKEDLRQKLGVTKGFAQAIAKRSKMIEKSLLPESPEHKAKELFKF